MKSVIGLPGRQVSPEGQSTLVVQDLIVVLHCGVMVVAAMNPRVTSVVSTIALQVSPEGQSGSAVHSVAVVRLHRPVTALEGTHVSPTGQSGSIEQQRNLVIEHRLERPATPSRKWALPCASTVAPSFACWALLTQSGEQLSTP